MSEIIVQQIIPAKENEPLVIAGNKTLKVNTLQHHLGTSIDVDKITVIHPSGDPELIPNYQFLVDDEGKSLTLKTETKTLTFQGIDSVQDELPFQTRVVENILITTSWQDLSFALNFATGTYALQIKSLDSDGKLGIYSAVVPYLSDNDQDTTLTSTQSVTLTRQGNDSNVLEIQLVRTASATPGTKVQIRGGSSSTLAHPSIEFIFRRLI